MTFDSLFQRWISTPYICVEPTADNFRTFAIDCLTDSDRIRFDFTSDELFYIVENHTDYFQDGPAPVS